MTRKKARRKTAHRKIAKGRSGGRSCRKPDGPEPIPDNFGPDHINFDDGFCNPYKIEIAADAREAQLERIMNNGWSRDEAKTMLLDRE
jgi:hypothetical protein